MMEGKPQLSADAEVGHPDDIYVLCLDFCLDQFSGLFDRHSCNGEHGISSNKKKMGFKRSSEGGMKGGFEVAEKGLKGIRSP